MNVHKNARMTVFGRERLVKQVLERGLTPAAAAAAAIVTRNIRDFARMELRFGRLAVIGPDELLKGEHDGNADDPGA